MTTKSIQKEPSGSSEVLVGFVPTQGGLALGCGLFSGSVSVVRIPAEFRTGAIWLGEFGKEGKAVNGDYGLYTVAEVLDRESLIAAWMKRMKPCHVYIAICCWLTLEETR
jgi:hypothetical protein